MQAAMRGSKLNTYTACLILFGAAFIELCGSANAETIPPTPLRAPKPPHVDRVSDPRALAEARAEKARDVLKRHCARCHERGQLQQLFPTGGIGNILDLAAVARRRDLIRPGHPNASPLFLSMLTREMPFDVFQQLKPGAEPSAAEIKAVHDWIEGLPQPVACAWKRSDTTSIASSIERDLQRIGPDLAKDRRYVSLYHIVGRCGGIDLPGAGERYRQAVTKLLNLLSRETSPVRPQPVDEQGLVLGFDLPSLGWTAADWTALVRRYQAPVPSFVTGTMSISAGTPLPVVPADWLAHEALEPDVYDSLVRLPSEISALSSYLGINLKQAPGSASTAVAISKVTGAARSILRHESPRNTPVWLAQDFAAESDPPDTHTAKKGAPAPVQSRMVFQLPNGFPGFALYGAHGMRRAVVHKSVLPADLKEANADRSGLQCLNCHAVGPSHFNKPNSTADVVGAKDRVDFLAIKAAFQEAGVDPDLLIEGHDPVIALALRHARDLSLQEAAAELGFDHKRLAERLLRLEGELQPAARRLLQGLISRREFARLAAVVLPNSSLTKPHAHREPLRLSIWSARDGNAEKDVVRINAAATVSCRLTLVSINAYGDAAVIFPNEFHTDNRLQAGRTIQVPGPKDGFRLRSTHPGKEAVVGICMAGERESPPGIRHNFKLHRFTLLGRWLDHIDQALSADEAERKRVGAAAPKKKRRKSRRRKSKPLPSRPNKLPLAQSRAMIVIGTSPAKNQVRPSQPVSAIERAGERRLSAQD